MDRMACTDHEQDGILQKSRNIRDLPAELLHMICVYLEPMDVARIRTLDRIIAAVGLKYLVPQIHLIPKADSFDRLLAVAEHPLANRYVTSLFYEADLLRSPRLFQVERKEWEKRIVGPEFAGRLEECQDPNFASACEILPRRYVRKPRRASVLKRQHHYTKREILQAYEKFRSYRAEQRRMHESVAYEEALVRAMRQLPYLTSLIISCNRGNTNHFRAAFEAGLSEDLKPAPSEGNRVGALQLSLLLCAADKAGLRITKLVCGSLGQLFLPDSSERCQAMTRSAQNLRSLHLFLSQTPESSGPNPGFNPVGMYSQPAYFLKLGDFTPDLETLMIRYDEDRVINPPNLEHFVMDTHWSRLASATFAKMSTRPETLIDFCGRHASTLKFLGLTDIVLYDGRWNSTFFEMRQRLELNKVELAGGIRSTDGAYWNLSHESYVKEIIQSYILHSDKSSRDMRFGQYYRGLMDAKAQMGSTC